MTYYQVIQNALKILTNKDDYCYLYGAKGQRLSYELISYFMSAEPNYFKKYVPSKKDEIMEYSRGKIGLDCSGFLNICCGQEKYSSAYWQAATNKTTPKAGTEGNVLYTTFGGTGRHVGLDIGYGYFLHFPRELTSCEIGRIADYPWEGSGHISGIDYTGAKA